MASRIRIFDHYMRLKAELNNIPTTPRSYLINEYGRCEFSMSTSDPKCTLSNLQYGNLIHIEHIPNTDENGDKKGKLPDWVGIILRPRNWNLGVCHVTAYSAEAILAFRAMPFVTVNGTPKNVFIEILNHVHSKAKNIIIQPGVLDDLPLTFPDDLRTNAYDHIIKLIKASGMDWSITGDINVKGNLELFANLYIRRGSITPLRIQDSNFELTNSNTELPAPLLTEQGTPANQVFGYSQSNTAQNRVMQEAIHQETYDDYGSLQINQIYSGKHDAASVLNSAKATVSRSGPPVLIMQRTALDKGDTFSHVAVGNIATVKETNAGFNPNGGFGFTSQARILGFSYNDLSNKCPMNIEVI